jgi:hypothetical protein
MIVNKGDIVVTDFGLFISEDYMNTVTENWMTHMREYPDSNTKDEPLYKKVSTKNIIKVITKITHPEYFL